jgi:hypothetical protein
VTYSALLQGFELPESLQFHGFFSQGYNLTSGNNFFGHSTNDGSLEYIELGANASWVPIDHLQLSGQLLFRRAGQTDPGSFGLDYGLLDYNFLSDETDSWGLRLGRVKNPIGFYNETRDVAFTRPSILLPQSIYPERVRSLTLSGDGFIVYGERRTDYGVFSLQSEVGYPQAVDRELDAINFGRRVAGKWNGNLSYVSRLLYEWNGGELRGGITYVQANVNYSSNFTSIPPSGKVRIEPWIFSLQYNTERWSLTSEAVLRHDSFHGLGVPYSFTEEGYYIQGSYRFYQGWEALLRYDVLYIDKDDKNGKKYAALSGLPAYSRFAKDWTVGLSWEITPQFLLRTEYHWTNGTGWLPPLDNLNPSATSSNWGLFLIMGSYRF